MTRFGYVELPAAFTSRLILLLAANHPPTANITS